MQESIFIRMLKTVIVYGFTYFLRNLKIIKEVLSSVIFV
jgi:hypothetical protein